MKRDCPSLLAALTVSLLVNAFLHTQSAYWPRAGAAAALICVPVLAGVGYLFSVAWRCGPSPLARLGFTALLLCLSVLELLRFWQMVRRLYPGTASLTVVCLMLLLPVLYLRRVSSLSQTAHVVLCLLVLGTGFLLLTVLPLLHFTNLQAVPLQADDYKAAAQAQLVLYPEYLLPAVWPKERQGPRCPRLRLAAIAIWFDVGLHLVLELFYGAAMLDRMDPIHAVARSGALSIFNRLESVQLILWIMALTLKLALYLYAMSLLLRHSRQSETSVRLAHFPLYFGGLWLLCLLFRRTNLEQAAGVLNAATWLFALLVGMGGAAVWLCRKIKRGC
ncbi:MAG: hypothetical protein ACLTWO_06645 [Blautia massiliensis (ex Durand et al. 2017)]|nr:MAG: hypothetical protein DBX91_14615 [Subdoligranulum variabile]